jgi:hypothetical protein
VPRRFCCWRRVGHLAEDLDCGVEIARGFLRVDAFLEKVRGGLSAARNAEEQRRPDGRDEGFHDHESTLQT